jgi:pimeloyl-ACP methyl ester carboxylesterase
VAAPDFTVQSGDVSIGVFVEGEGAPVVMVHGSIADHTTFDALVAELAPSLKTFRMDRRGFGASGDAPGYTIAREYEDVAAVVDAVALQSGGPVALFGHSYGANCALGGAVASDNVSHLALYEPSLGLRYPSGCIESIEAAIERGDRDAAIVAVLSTILEMTPAEIDGYRQSPVWPDRLRAAHTVPRECRIEEARSFESTSWPVQCPTVVMTGSATTHDLAAIARNAVAAIDGAQLRVLEGHDHMAPRSAPDVVANHLIALLQT